MKKIFIVCITILTMCLSFTNVFANEETSKDLGEYIRSTTYYIRQKQTIIDENTEFNEGDRFQVSLYYGIPRDVINNNNNNKVYTYQLPTKINMTKITYLKEDGSALFGPITRNGISIGRYTISEDGFLTLIYNDDYNTKNDTLANTFTVVVSQTKELTNINVTKKWEDNNNEKGKRSTNITARLYANGNDTNKTVVLNETNHWSASFEDLYKKENGEDISYTIKEDEVEGYTSNISGDVNNGFTITNTIIPEKTKEKKEPKENSKTESKKIRKVEKVVNTSDNTNVLFSLVLLFISMGIIINYRKLIH